MEKVLIALERSKFNYLYKYDTCHVSHENIIENSLEGLLDYDTSGIKPCAAKIEIALPIFEQEHEVLLVEYIKTSVNFNHGIEISFDGVIQIIPLNEIAKELLSTKINQDFKIADPLPTELYENITLIRQDKIRHRTGLRLINLFNLPQPNELYIHQVKRASSYKILGKEIEKGSSSLMYLLDFDTTPSFIPEGNVEGFIKLACVAMRKAGAEISLVPKGPFYKIVHSNISAINKGKLRDAYETLVKILIDVPEEDKKKVDTLKRTLALPELEENTFFIYYLFFSFKRELQKNDFNLSVLTSEILESKKEYPREVASAMYLIGYTLSMASLYNSIHRIRRVPIFSLPIEKTTSEDSLRAGLELSNSDSAVLGKEPLVGKEESFNADSQKSKGKHVDPFQEFYAKPLENIEKKEVISSIGLDGNPKENNFGDQNKTAEGNNSEENFKPEEERISDPDLECTSLSGSKDVDNEEIGPEPNLKLEEKKENGEKSELGKFQLEEEKVEGVKKDKKPDAGTEAIENQKESKDPVVDKIVDILKKQQGKQMVVKELLGYLKESGFPDFKTNTSVEEYLKNNPEKSTGLKIEGRPARISYSESLFQL